MLKEIEKTIVICSSAESERYVEGIDVFCIGCDKKIFLSDDTVQGVKKKYPDTKIEPFCISCAFKKGFFSKLSEQILKKLNDTKHL